MKKTLIILGLCILAGTIAISSCNRDDFSVAEEEDLLQQAENEAVTEMVLQNIEDQIDKEINLLESANYNPATLKSAEAGACSPVITVETPEKSKFPKTITLDYGSGCTDSNGNFRAGKVIVQITGPYWEKNTVRIARLVDYLFNDLKVAGERREMNKGTNESGYYLFEVKHSLKITKAANGELVSDRGWNRERIYDRGKDLKTNTDDQVWISGSAKVEKNGKTLVKEITKPLYRMMTCKYFMSGEITTFINKEKTTSLDYGDGSCDDQATWTNFKTNKTKTITLKPGINYFSIQK